MKKDTYGTPTVKPVGGGYGNVQPDSCTVVAVVLAVVYAAAGAYVAAVYAYAAAAVVAVATAAAYLNTAVDC